MTRVSTRAGDLAAAAHWAAKLIPSHPVAPLMGCALLNAADVLGVSVYDYDTWGATSVPATAAEPGRLLVSGRLLAEILATIPPDADVLIEHGEAHAVLSAGRATWRMPVMQFEDYPVEPGYGQPLGTVDGAAWRKAVGRLAPIADRTYNSARVALSAIEIMGTPEGLSLATTDGSSLGTTLLDWTPAEGHADLTALPLAAMIESSSKPVQAGAPVTLMGDGGGSFGLAFAGRYVAGRVLAEKYVDWRPALARARADHAVTVDLSELARALQQVAVVAVDRKGPGILRVRFGPDWVSISGSADDHTGEASAPTRSLQGDPIEMGFSAARLGAALKSIDSPTVVIYLPERASAMIVIAPADEQGMVCDPYRHAIAPMRLGESW